VVRIIWFLDDTILYRVTIRECLQEPAMSGTGLGVADNLVCDANVVRVTICIACEGQ
jgi:hypothetical protein